MNKKELWKALHTPSERDCDNCVHKDLGGSEEPCCRCPMITKFVTPVWEWNGTK